MPNTKKDNKKTNVSAKDVARAAGVSQSTVSRVLSGRQTNMISEATCNKVLQIAKEIGYSPNPFAQALRGNRSNLLGLIVREIADPFFSKLISELSIQARSQGCHIVLGNAGSDPIQAFEINNYLDMRHTDGVFLIGDLHDDEGFLNELLGEKQAVVALCRGRSPASLHTVNTDNREGIFLLMDHLRGLGHTKFGFLNGGWLGDIRERLDAYREYMSIHNLINYPDWIQTDVNTAEGGYLATTRLLKLTERPTALLTSDDEMATGAIRCLINAGMHLPADMSVTGFDNIDLGGYLSPALTTIEQSVKVMCSEALTIMTRLIDNPDSITDPMVIRIKPELILRESTGPVSE